MLKCGQSVQPALGHGRDIVVVQKPKHKVFTIEYSAPEAVAFQNNVSSFV